MKLILIFLFLAQVGYSKEIPHGDHAKALAPMTCDIFFSDHCQKIIKAKPDLVSWPPASKEVCQRDISEGVTEGLNVPAEWSENCLASVKAKDGKPDCYDVIRIASGLMGKTCYTYDLIKAWKDGKK